MLKEKKNDFISKLDGAFPLVSVFCPSYNAERFIENTLLSILKQDYQNFEIIVSDDCSTDNTVAIVRRIMEQFPDKIVLNVNSTNLGITDNCNVTLKLCRGKYLAFFAGDDLMYPGKITAQVDLMESEKDCSLTYHAVDVLDGENENKVLFTTEMGKQSYFSFLDIITRGGMIGACSIMAKMDAIPSYGFSTEFPNVSDWLIHIEIALRGKVLKVERVLAGYIRHDKGASRKTFETLDEISGILNFINNRYSNSNILLGATRKAYKRYILGEFARLFVSGDVQRLLQLNKKYLSQVPFLKMINYFLLVLILFRINNTSVVRSMVSKLSSAVK